MSWHRGPLLALDFESTGIDTDTARIVTGTLVDIQPGCGPVIHNWLVNPGVPIPDEAAKIHGVTSEIAEAKGVPPAEAIGEIRALLHHLWTPTIPLIAYNVVYDATLLDRELRRHGWPEGLEIRGPIVDGLVIDKHLDQYRRGSRKLVDTCALYDVELKDAHTSAADALAAARLAWKLAAKHAEVREMGLNSLHAAQRSWYAEQQASFSAYRRKQAARETDPVKRAELLAQADSMTGDWPVRPCPDALAVSA